MNQDNFEYLKKQVKYSGFGDALEFALQDAMEKGAETFDLKHKAEFGKDEARATLHFKKSEQGTYFFNSYDMELSKAGKDDLKQTFYINRPVLATTDNGTEKQWVNSTLTFKEAYNLMEGRSVLKDLVNKEKEAYTSWVSLDFKNTDKHGNYELRQKGDYDLSAKLDTLPIKGLDNPDTKKQIIESLQKGNLHPVIMVHNGMEAGRTIAANPQFKGINVFEGSMRINTTETQKAAEGTKRTQKNDVKAEDDESGGSKQKRKQSRRIA